MFGPAKPTDARTLASHSRAARHLLSMAHFAPMPAQCSAMHAILGIGGGAAWRSRRCWRSEEACCGDEAAAPQRDRRVARRSCIVVVGRKVVCDKNVALDESSRNYGIGFPIGQPRRGSVLQWRASS